MKKLRKKTNRVRDIKRITKAQDAWKAKGYWLAEFSGASSIVESAIQPGGGCCIRGRSRPVGFETFGQVLFMLQGPLAGKKLSHLIERCESVGGDTTTTLFKKWAHSQRDMFVMPFTGSPVVTVPLVWLEHEEEGLGNLALFNAIDFLVGYEAQETLGNYISSFPPAPEFLEMMGWEGPIPEVMT